jgi:hypothetical protein
MKASLAGATPNGFEFEHPQGTHGRRTFNAFHFQPIVCRQATGGKRRFAVVRENLDGSPVHENLDGSKPTRHRGRLGTAGH